MAVFAMAIVMACDPSHLSKAGCIEEIRRTDEYFCQKYSVGFSFEVEEYTSSRISGITSKPRLRQLRFDFVGEKRRVVMGSLQSGPASVLCDNNKYCFDITRELNSSFGLHAYQADSRSGDIEGIKDYIAFFDRLAFAGVYVVDDRLVPLLEDPSVEFAPVESITADESVLHLTMKETQVSVRLKRLLGHWYVAEVEKTTPGYAKWVQENIYRVVDGLLCPEKITLETVALRRAGSVNQRWEFQPPRRFSDPDSVFTLAHYGVEAPEVFGEDVRFGMSRRWRWLLTGNVAALAILIGIAWTVQRWRRTRPDRPT